MLFTVDQVFDAFKENFPNKDILNGRSFDDFLTKNVSSTEEKRVDSAMKDFNRLAMVRINANVVPQDMFVVLYNSFNGKSYRDIKKDILVALYEESSDELLVDDGRAKINEYKNRLSDLSDEELQEEYSKRYEGSKECLLSSKELDEAYKTGQEILWSIQSDETLREEFKFFKDVMASCEANDQGFENNPEWINAKEAKDLLTGKEFLIRAYRYILQKYRVNGENPDERALEVLSCNLSQASWVGMPAFALGKNCPSIDRGYRIIEIDFSAEKINVSISSNNLPTAGPLNLFAQADLGYLVENGPFVDLKLEFTLKDEEDGSRLMYKDVKLDVLFHGKEEKENNWIGYIKNMIFPEHSCFKSYKIPDCISSDVLPSRVTTSEIIANDDSIVSHDQEEEKCGDHKSDDDWEIISLEKKLTTDIDQEGLDIDSDWEIISLEKKLTTDIDQEGFDSYSDWTIISLEEISNTISNYNNR